MMIRIIRWATLSATLWKNGGGTAVDIAMSPNTGSGEAVDWRINVATIARSGPFSGYPEIDRDFRVLDGGPVELAVAGRQARLLHAGGEAYVFPGDVPTNAQLLGEPCRVFNVLTRRGAYTASVRSVDVDRTMVVTARGSTFVGFLLAGTVEIDVEGAPVRLGPFDAFVASSLVSVSSQRGGRAIVVDLSPADG